jgi:hypothetical protein
MPVNPSLQEPRVRGRNDPAGPPQEENERVALAMRNATLKQSKSVPSDQLAGGGRGYYVRKEVSFFPAAWTLQGVESGERFLKEGS